METERDCGVKSEMILRKWVTIIILKVGHNHLKESGSQSSFSKAMFAQKKYEGAKSIVKLLIFLDSGYNIH